MLLTHQSGICRRFSEPVTTNGDQDSVRRVSAIFSSRRFWIKQFENALNPSDLQTNPISITSLHQRSDRCAKIVSKLFYNSSKSVRFRNTYFRTLLLNSYHFTDFQSLTKLGTGIGYILAGQLKSEKEQKVRNSKTTRS